MPRDGGQKTSRQLLRPLLSSWLERAAHCEQRCLGKRCSLNSSKGEAAEEMWGEETMGSGIPTTYKTKGVPLISIHFKKPLFVLMRSLSANIRPQLRQPRWPQLRESAEIRPVYPASEYQLCWGREYRLGKTEALPLRRAHCCRAVIQQFKCCVKLLTDGCLWDSGRPGSPTTAQRAWEGFLEEVGLPSQFGGASAI